MTFDKSTWDYCLSHTTPEDAVLESLDRASHLRTLHPQMIAGAFQGKLLEFFSFMMRPMYILEIGSFTGYSAICLAKGLQDNGKLHAIEVNKELAYIFHEFVAKAGLQHKVELHNGDAAEVIQTFDNDYFDLIFLDAGKLDYPHHFQLAFPKLKVGGFLLADNVLWSGKVINDPHDPTAEVLRSFNQSIQQDERVENLLLPLRDGLMFIRKIK